MAKACEVCRGQGGVMDHEIRDKPYWRECLVCDGLGVVDVPWIRGHGGIDHILTSSKGGWDTTACQSWGPGGGEKHSEPKRRCRKCRAEMKKGRPWQDGQSGWPRSMAADDA